MDVKLKNLSVKVSYISSSYYEGRAILGKRLYVAFSVYPFFQGSLRRLNKV